MLKHSLQPVTLTLRGRRRASDNILDATVVHFDGIHVPLKYMSAFKRIHLKGIINLKGESHKAIFSASPNVPVTSHTPYNYCTKSTFTMHQFTNSSVGESVIRKCSGPIKKIQLGLFETGAKVIFTDEYRSVNDMTGSEKDVPEEILCFLKRSHCRVSLDYLGHQANHLIEQIKLCGREKLHGFCIYKNLFPRYRKDQQDYIIEFFLAPNCGQHFIEDLELFASISTDVDFNFGIFQPRDVIERI